MKILKTENDLNDLDTDLAFVPTMGALHAGHLELVRIAKATNKKVVVSIFVNPTQFGKNEDLDKYPRTLDDDKQKLKSLDVDYLFLPDQALIYPQGLAITHYANDNLAHCLCGLQRPGHFDGVCTVVYKLFSLLKPQIAVFGEKDYQQLMIIKDLVKHEKLNIEIVQAPVVREDSGLAMSSRNQYLTDLQKQDAALLYENLAKIKNQELTIEDAKVFLTTKGFQIEYLEQRWQRLFLAAKLGTVRLIDNIACNS